MIEQIRRTLCVCGITSVLAASRWCLDFIKARGGSHPAELNQLGKTLMEGLRGRAQARQIPLHPQGPGLVFHTLMLKPGSPEGPVQNYRDYVQRQDTARWTHLRRCLLEAGVRAIERGLWFLSLAHSSNDIDQALQRAESAFARHDAEWKP